MTSTSTNTSIDGKTLVRQFYAEVDAGNAAALGELLAEDFTMHVAGMSEPLDVAGLAAFGRQLAEALPDMRHTIHDQVAEGDRVVTRLTFRGTHRGTFQGIPATGATVEVTAINIHRIADGRLAEQWAAIDQLTLLRQLGAVA